MNEAQEVLLDENLRKVANRALAICNDRNFQFGEDACTPIGKYLYLEKDSWKELPNDEIIEELAKSLKILGQIGYFAAANAAVTQWTGVGTSIIDVIKKYHSLDNYNIVIRKSLFNVELPKDLTTISVASGAVDRKFLIQGKVEEIGANLEKKIHLENVSTNLLLPRMNLDRIIQLMLL